MGSEIATNAPPLAVLDTLLEEGAFESVQILADIVISTYQGRLEPWGGRFFALAGQACLATRDDGRAKASHEYGRRGELEEQSAVKYEIARLHFFQGNWNEAIMEIESISSKHRNTGIQLLLAKCYERLSCNRAAKATYADAVRGQPLAVEAILSLTSLNSAIERNQRYDELCKQSIQRVPTVLQDVMTIIWKAKSSLSSSDFGAKVNAARICWEKADSLSTNIEFLSTMFQLSMWMRNWTQSARAARLLKAADPALASQREASPLTWALIEAGHLEEAYMWSTKPLAIEGSGEHCGCRNTSTSQYHRAAGMWVTLAEIHRRRGSVGIADQLLLNAADADGEDLASYHLSCGLVQISKKNLSRAILSLRQARRVGEGTYWAALAVYYLSDTMGKAGRLQDAAKYAEEAAAIQPLPEPLLMAAYAMNRIGDVNRAQQYLEQSLKACPGESLKEVVNGQKTPYESKNNIWGGNESRRLVRELLQTGDERLIEVLRKRINTYRLKIDVQETGSGAGRRRELGGQSGTPFGLESSQASDIVANLFSV